MTKTPKTTKAPKKTPAPLPAAKPTRAARKAAPVAPSVAPATEASPQEAPATEAFAQETRATLAPAATTPLAPPKATRGDGVIATLIALLRGGGGTKAELYQGLLAKFPARGEGMKITVSVQLAGLPRAGKLVIHKGTNESGEVRYWADPLPVEGTAPTA